MLPNHYPSAETFFLYFLTPLAQWASPPPERVDIKLQLPAGRSALNVRSRIKPTCIDRRTLWFRFRSTVPTVDLEVGFFDTDARPETPEEWRAWKDSRQAQLSCDLLDEAAGSAGPVLAAYLRDRAAEPCVASCSEPGDSRRFDP